MRGPSRSASAESGVGRKHQVRAAGPSSSQEQTLCQSRLGQAGTRLCNRDQHGRGRGWLLANHGRREPCRRWRNRGAGVYGFRCDA